MSDASSIAAPADGGPPAAAYRRRTIATNFLAMTVVSGIVLVVGIFTTAYSRRVLGPAAIGEVNWNASLIAFLALLASPGLQVIGQRDIAARPHDTARVAALVLGLQAVLAVVAYALIVAIALLDPRGDRHGLLLPIQGLIVLVNAANLAWVLQAHQRMAGPAIASLVINLAQIPALLVLVRSPDDLYVFAAYSLPFSLALAGYQAWYLRRQRILRLGELRPTLAGGRALLSQSWPMALSLLAVLVVSNSGALLLGFSRGDVEVGLYTTAYKLMFISTVASGAMMSAYFPVLSQVAGDGAQARRVAADFATLMTWMGLPVAALGWACGRHVNDLLFGASFAAAGPYFEWLCLAVAFSFTNIGLGTPLLAWGHQKLHLKIIGGSALASLGLNAVLIPAHGAWGAIAALLLAETATFVVLVAARRWLALGRTPLAPLLLPPFLCSAAVALAIVALPAEAHRYWWLEVALGAAALGGCLLAFERRIAKGAFALLRRRR